METARRIMWACGLYFVCLGVYGAIIELWLQSCFSLLMSLIVLLIIMLDHLWNMNHLVMDTHMETLQTLKSILNKKG